MTFYPKRVKIRGKITEPCMWEALPLQSNKPIKAFPSVSRHIRTHGKKKLMIKIRSHYKMQRKGTRYLTSGFHLVGVTSSQRYKWMFDNKHVTRCIHYNNLQNIWGAPTVVENFRNMPFWSSAVARKTNVSKTCVLNSLLLKYSLNTVIL